jgi:hypothetical protein
MRSQGRLRAIGRECHASRGDCGNLSCARGFNLALLGQAESARPFTLTTPVDVNGFGDTLDDRAVVNGVQTTLDEFRGTPYIQIRHACQPAVQFSASASS